MSFSLRRVRELNSGQRDRGGSLKRKHDSLIASFWVEALSRKQPFLSDCRSRNKHTILSLLNALLGTEHAEAVQKEECLLR